jgi:hypothetical protein
LLRGDVELKEELSQMRQAELKQYIDGFIIDPEASRICTRARANPRLSILRDKCLNPNPDGFKKRA